jgi:hypothetical protein
VLAGLVLGWFFDLEVEPDFVSAGFFQALFKGPPLRLRVGYVKQIFL